MGCSVALRVCLTCPPFQSALICLLSPTRVRGEHRGEALRVLGRGSYGEGPWGPPIPVQGLVQPHSPLEAWAQEAGNVGTTRPVYAVGLFLDRLDIGIMVLGEEMLGDSRNG